MDLSMIQEGSIIIAPSYLHTHLRKCMLKEKNAIANIRICSLNAFLSDNKKYNDTSSYEYYKVLKEMKDTLIYNQKTACTFAYINELKNFINEMKYYDIPVSALPEKDVFQIESKRIIEALYSIDTSADFHKRQLNKVLNTFNFSNVYIINDYSSFYEQKIYKAFLERKATAIPFEYKEKNTSFYHALNKRQEISSIAQYIVEHDLLAEEIQLSYLEESYIPYIHQIFKRYEIPYFISDEKEKSDLLQRFIALCNFYIKKDIPSCIDLFLTHTFSHPYANELIEYMKLHKKNFYDAFTICDSLSISEDIVSKQEIKHLIELEKKAIQAKEANLSLFHKIFEQDNLLEFLLSADQYLCESFSFERKEDRFTLLKIREEIKKCIPYITSKEDLPYLISSISSITTPIKENEKGVTVSKLKHSIYKPVQFVVGCTQNNYPGFKGKSGIFDEYYYQFLPYPTLKSRYDLHLKQCLHALNNCDTLICFSPLSDIDGKSCESSLEIEAFTKSKGIRYPLKENDNQNNRKYEMSKDYVSTLFVRDNKIHGSISSLERYMNCKYSYFLKYGLRLKEPVDYSFNVAKCGTLIHYVFEQLIKQKKKDYVFACEEEVEALLEEKIQEIILLYPSEEKTFMHLKKRLSKAILLNLEILKDHEEHSSLLPSECEYQFEYTFKIDDTHTFTLHGIIDRIDINKDFVRVVDYKSSAHSLKEDQVFAAQQLQLITYLIIAQETFKRRPLGGFYYSMALPNVSIKYAKLKKRPLQLEVYEQEHYYSSFLKENRMHGWVVGDNTYYIEPMDDNAAHIVGLSNSKASGLNARTVYCLDALKSMFEEMYASIGKSILEGDISCDYTKDSCTYCPYLSVCMKSHNQSFKEVLVEAKDNLYLKGGK